MRQEPGGAGSVEVVEGLHRAPGGPYRSLARLSKVVTTLLAVNIAFDFVSVILDVQGVQLVERIRAGETVPFQEGQAHDDRMRIAGILQVAGLVAAGIPFLMWMRRAYRNLGPLGTKWLRFKPGWAVGGWFVPFLWWARPKSILNDVWRASNPELPRDLLRPPAGAYVPAVMNWWWGFYVAASLVYPTAALEERQPSLEEIEGTFQQYAAGDAMFVVAGFLAIQTVLRVTRRQEQRHAMLLDSAPKPDAAATQPQSPRF
ncbi:MAG TPA: DUF4328 domain-containing protein [Actinomycetota bacterium]|nr:DUF4328 domain-containing protein [Actinomycetota bacterium]